MRFEDVKNELKTRVSSLWFFDRQFYKLYLDCLKKTRENVENDVDDSYFIFPGVTGFHSWDGVYHSRFYRENSGAYCEFLAVVNGRV